jgi:hypothetical protein
MYAISSGGKRLIRVLREEWWGNTSIRDDEKASGEK